MDRSVDPCQDFYRYSCGGWIRDNPIPPDRTRWDVYGKMQQENQRLLWGILEEAAAAPGSDPVKRQIGDYFSACMNQPAVERAGLASIQPRLDEIAALKSIRQLAPLLSRLHLETQGGGLLFGFDVNQDFADSTQMIAFFSAGGLGLPNRDYYTKTDAKSVETRQRYLAHIARMLELAGDSPSAAQTGAKAILDIETALARASLTQAELRDPYKVFHKMPVSRLRTLAPAFDWSAYVKTYGLAAREANVTEPAFFRQVNTLLKTRPIAEWKTYLRWHVLHASARYLPQSIVDEDFAFYSAYLRGQKEQQARWKRCVAWTDRDLGEALGRIYVEKTFTPDTKARALEMLQRIEQAMETDIQGLTWMSAPTKARALDKLHLMVNKIGYPAKWRDYSGLAVSRDSFLANVRNAAVFESRRQLAKIGKPIDRGEWFMTPPEVNAYYNPQMNDMNFPAGVLQPPLFDPKMDDAPNYGNTGATMGHELTHGFDDEGRQFDGKGNLKDWWTKQDAEAFSQRADCVVQQYAGYTVVDDVKINSKLTLGEDVADLGGTMLAYMAWKKATETQRLEPIGGLTPDQRFFVGMAQWACGDERPESKRVNAIVNPHSPLEYRINGVVSNMPEFGQAFACKAGQPMVRENACRVW
ncbi:MAG: M13 family metallopeptidase [Acidobacteria bacterium]|nr:M13 family metallopeptidase [Acidobacteriota bacterium]